jgi:hypothetical protein
MHGWGLTTEEVLEEVQDDVVLGQGEVEQLPGPALAEHACRQARGIFRSKKKYWPSAGIAVVALVAEQPFYSWGATMHLRCQSTQTAAHHGQNQQKPPCKPRAI